MNRFLVILPLLLMHLSAYADVAPETPPESSGVTGFIIFGIIFLGVCAGFVWMIIRADKKGKNKQAE